MRWRDAVFLGGFIVLGVILGGCGLFTKPAPKMETGETPGVVLQDRAFLDRFSSAPREFYDIDESAAALFNTLAEKDWENARKILGELRSSWQNVQPGATEKARAAADAALDKLAAALTAQKTSDACWNLNRFMANVSKTSEDYQLSPASDIINVGIAVREAGLYAADENWGKAAAKSKELENVWNQSKPALEQVGIMGKMTKAHSLINQILDAIDTENKDAVLENLGEVDKTFGEIRKFYYGK